MKQTVQYTIRNIPANIDRTLRKRMKEQGKSLNEVAIDALASGSDESRHQRDLSYLIGSLSAKEARDLEEEIKAQKIVDLGLWQ